MTQQRSIELPIGCSWCRAVRLGGPEWTPPESPLFDWARSHGICTACAESALREIDEEEAWVEELYRDVGGEG